MFKRPTRLQRVKRWFSRGKAIAIALSTIGFLGLTFAFLNNTFTLVERFFNPPETVFKTVQIFPNPEKDGYPFCIIPDEGIIPIANPLPLEENPKQLPGPPQNVIFTITNNSKQELLIDKIEAVQIEYVPLPERHVVTTGAFVVLQPIDLLLVLSPKQDKYDLTKGQLISIRGGTTEHVFRMWVSGREPGIYKFRISASGRIGGVENRVIESDTTYSFAVADSKSPVADFFYSPSPISDPNYRDLISLVNKPVDEFKQITSNWGDFKIIDDIHNAPKALQDLIRIPYSALAETPDTKNGADLLNKKASDLTLTKNDIRENKLLIDGQIIELSVNEEELPNWLISKKPAIKPKPFLSANSVKYSVNYRSWPSPVVVYNTVIVCSSVNLAREAFSNLRNSFSEARDFEQERFGDEAFKSSVPGMEVFSKVIVFRKGNLVTLFIGIQDLGLLERVAQQIDTKIGN